MNNQKKPVLRCILDEGVYVDYTALQNRLTELLLDDGPDDDLVDFVISQLEFWKTDADKVELAWVATVVRVAENTQIKDPKKRKVLGNLLYEYAITFCHDPTLDVSVWSAMRKFSSMDFDWFSLGAFLTDGNRPVIIQIALQRLAAMFAVQPLAHSKEANVLRDELRVILEKYFTADLNAGSEKGALSLNCYCTALLAEVPGLESYTERMVASPMVMLCLGALRDSGADMNVKGTIGQAISKLKTAVQAEKDRRSSAAVT